MPDPVLWARDDHTAAKHQVLRAYLDAWIPVMGYQSLKVSRPSSEKPTLLLVDGFAGPGRYLGGEPGSPLILLDALTSRADTSKLAAVQFLYLFIEEDLRRVDHLKGELEGLDLPANVRVRTEHGRFETTFSAVLDEIRPRRLLVPTFAFIDPFGYSAASMSITGRFLNFPRSEALFFLPLSFIHRFVGRTGQEAALTALFDTDRWREAIALEGDDRRAFLLQLFCDQLQQQGQVKHVRSFQLVTRDGNDYRLVFATGHERGLELMKRAMWSVDPIAGARYVTRTNLGQEVLFQPQVDTGPLLAQLADAFDHRWFTIEEASKFTLLQTPFLHDRHLKGPTLAPAEKAGLIEAQRPSGSRAGTFADGVRIRFV
jgi:three-Cys-motif partner protein